ncbi:MAG: LuxR C-terminal-related transcriptional regulator [Gemmatimonadales bacterium]
MRTSRACAQVLIAHSSPVMRAGLRAILRDLEGCQVRAEAADIDTVVDLLQTMCPDVALLEGSLPPVSGVDAMIKARRECPSLRVVLVGSGPAERWALHALNCGADGILSNRADPNTVRQAVGAVMRGERMLGPHVTAQVLHDYVRHDHSAAHPRVLTSRQRDIVQLIAAGHTSKEIAGILDLSVRTVRHHRADLMTRLGLHDIASIVRWAVSVGVIDPVTGGVASGTVRALG